MSINQKGTGNTLTMNQDSLNILSNKAFGVAKIILASLPCFVEKK